jgi:hypothetical protein
VLNKRNKGIGQKRLYIYIVRGKKLAKNGVFAQNIASLWLII